MLGTGFLYLFDCATLALRDSVALAPIPGDIGYVDQIVPSPTGLLYLTGAGYLYAFSLSAHALVATAPRSSPSTVALAPDGQTLYVTDPGAGDATGTGKIAVYGDSLQVRPPIDLTTVAGTSGTPPRTVGAAVSLDGTTLYVSAGSPVAGPSGPFQPGRLLVLDPAGRSLPRSILLGAEGPDALFVRLPVGH